MSLASKCGNCRYAVPGSLIPSAGISLKSTLKSSTKRPTRALASTRAFKTIACQRSDFVQQNENSVHHGTDEASLEAQLETHTNEDLEPTLPLPWYLQVDTPQKITSPLSERQQLPELPPNPPQLLQPILEYISVDLGLDDLALFDLRKIDPPTALGANLLMIIGTSRSEKHLHVSADRFCSWLRNTYKLSPYADGLLGRGELKLKLKRKARRAKLLSNVGSSEGSSVDDGLKTGWVCVNLGTIDDGKNATEASVLPEGFVGFGGQVKGTRIVVQMLTEQKREELNLEELWEGVLARYERKQAKNLELAKDAKANQEVGQTSLGTNAKLSSKSYPIPSFHQVPSSTHDQQKRFYSLTRYCMFNDDNRKDADFPSIDPPITELRSRHIFASGYEEISLDIELPTEEMFKFMLEERGLGFSKLAVLESDIVTVRELKRQIDNLRGLSRQDALDALGDGFEDFGSTPFLALFYQSFPLFPGSIHWIYRWALVSYAIKIGHQKYQMEDLMKLFSEIRISGVVIPKIIYNKVFGILTSPENFLSSTTFPCLRKVNEALQVIEEMRIFYDRGPSRQKLIRLFALAANAPVHQLKLDTQLRLHPNALQRLRSIIEDDGTILTDLNLSLYLLNTFADNNNWSEFWQHWRYFARCMQPKPKELYYLMFERLARAGHQVDCIDALRTWVPEMELENPPVNLGEVAPAVMDCLRVAEPEAESDSHHEKNLNSEWVKLWKLCEDSLCDYKM